MFASQLLRLLESIPIDVKYETCVSDSAEQNMTMKENQNETLYGSISFGNEADPMVFKSKEVYQINGFRKDTNPSAYELKGGDKSWNPKFADDQSTDNGLLYHLSSLEEHADSLSSEPNANKKVQSSPDHECSVAGEEIMHHNENESRDFRSPNVAASNLFEKDSGLLNDELVLEYESPELIVCYKEINYHVVKDICVDEGIPVYRKILSDGRMDDRCKATGDIDEELLISDGLSATSLENTESIIANEHGSEEESHGILISQGRPQLPFDKDTGKDCDQEDSLQKGETNFSATSKTVIHASEESFVDRSLPIQEYGTRSFLRSFLYSLDGEEITVKQPPDQISSGKVVSEGHAPSSAEAGPKEDVQTGTLCYNSEVETGSITFNFNSLMVGDDTNGKTENVKEQSIDSQDVLDHKDAEADNLSDARQVHCEISNDTSSGNVHDQDKDEHRDPDGDFVVSLRKYDQGESSFSASDLINYSGHIAYSGNLSLCSDGSATSGRSFAFPILQPEWSTSPVRMTKSNGRHFRRPKGWRSGLLCCRF